MPSRFDEMEARLEASRKSPSYLMEAAIEAALDEVHGRLDELGWTDADLARSMGISRTRAHHILRGEDQNFTIRTLASLACSLGTGLSINFPPKGYVAVPIYRPLDYTKGVGQPARTRLTVGRTTLEGPAMRIDNSAMTLGEAA